MYFSTSKKEPGGNTTHEKQFIFFSMTVAFAKTFRNFAKYKNENNPDDRNKRYGITDQNRKDKMMNKEVKVLGPGCAKCKTLDKLTREVVAEQGWNVTVTKVEDIVEIMQYNVLAPPALVVDNQVIHKGGVPGREKLVEMLKTAIDG